jgi:hypothetical protein
MVIPAAWIEFFSRVDAWWLNGAALIGGATGLAILWTGLTGVAPDWQEEVESRKSEVESQSKVGTQGKG